MKDYGVDCGDGLTWAGGSWEPGGEFTQRLTVRNISMSIMRIKYKLPTTKFFSMEFPDPIRLAPGNAVQLEVRFRPIRYEEYDDFVEFSVPRGTFRVPIIAKLPRLAFVAPERTDFGVAPVNEVSSLDFYLENIGEVEAAFQWEVSPPFSLHPAAGSVPANCRQLIRCDLCPPSAHTFTTVARCAVDGGQQTLRMSLAGVGKYQFICLDPQRVDFGDAFIGGIKWGGAGARAGVALEDAAALAQGQQAARAGPHRSAAADRAAASPGSVGDGDSTALSGMVQAATAGSRAGAASGGGGGGGARSVAETPAQRAQAAGSRARGAMGRTLSQVVCVRNPSFVRATVTSARVSSDCPSQFRFGPSSLLVPGNDGEGRFPLSYTPRVAGSFVCERYRLSTPGGNTATLVVSACARGPRVSARRKDPAGARAGASGPQRPNSINFGDVRVGEWSRQVVRLTNTSPRDAPCAFLVGRGCVFDVRRPRVVVPSSSHVDVIVTFAPRQPSNYYRRLYILVEDGSPTFLDMLGSGFDDARRPMPVKQRHVDAYRLRPSAARRLGPDDLLALAADCEAVAGRGDDPEAELPLALTCRDTRAHERELRLLEEEGGKHVTRSGERARGGVALLEELQRPLDHEACPVALLDQSLAFGSVQWGGTSEAQVVRVQNRMGCKVTALWLPPVSAARAAQRGDGGNAAMAWEQEEERQFLAAQTAGGAAFAVGGGVPRHDFWVEPAELDLEPGATAEFQVRFAPSQADLHYGTELECVVFPKQNRTFRLVDEAAFVPAQTLPLRVSGNSFPSLSQFTPQLQCSMSEPDHPEAADLAFPACHIGDCVHATVTLRNTGEVGAEYRVEPDPTGIFSVFPPAGVIHKGDFDIIILTFRPSALREYRHSFEVELNGNPVGMGGLCINCAGQATLPAIAMPDLLGSLAPGRALSAAPAERRGVLGRGGPAGSIQRELVLRPAAVGAFSTGTLQLQSVSRVPALFRWKVPPELQRELRLSPPCGLLRGNEDLTVHVTFRPRREGRRLLKLPLLVFSAGGAPGAGVDEDPDDDGVHFDVTRGGTLVPDDPLLSTQGRSAKAMAALRPRVAPKAPSPGGSLGRAATLPASLAVQQLELSIVTEGAGGALVFADAFEALGPTPVGASSHHHLQLRNMSDCTLHWQLGVEAELLEVHKPPPKHLVRPESNLAGGPSELFPLAAVGRQRARQGSASKGAAGTVHFAAAATANMGGGGGGGGGAPAGGDAGDTLSIPNDLDCDEEEAMWEVKEEEDEEAREAQAATAAAMGLDAASSFRLPGTAARRPAAESEAILLARREPASAVSITPSSGSIPARASATLDLHFAPKVAGEFVFRLHYTVTPDEGSSVPSHERGAAVELSKRLALEAAVAAQASRSAVVAAAASRGLRVRPPAAPANANPLWCDVRTEAAFPTILVEDIRLVESWEALAWIFPQAAAKAPQQGAVARAAAMRGSQRGSRNLTGLRRSAAGPGDSRALGASQSLAPATSASTSAAMLALLVAEEDKQGRQPRPDWGFDLPMISSAEEAMGSAGLSRLTHANVALSALAPTAYAGGRPGVVLTPGPPLANQAAPDRLWQQVAARALNRLMSIPLTAPERRFNAATPAQRDVGDLACVPITFTPAPAGSPPEVWVVTLRNPAPVPAVITILGPGEEDARETEPWAEETPAADRDEAASAVLQRDVLGVYPRQLTVPAGGSGALRFHHAHPLEDGGQRHECTLLMRIEHGRQVRLLLRGETLHQQAPKLFHTSPTGVQRLQPVAMGCEHPPVQPVGLFNPSVVPVEWRIDPECLERVAASNHGFPVLRAHVSDESGDGGSGVVGPGERLDVRLVAQPIEAREYRSELVIQYRAARPARRVSRSRDGFGGPAGAGEAADDVDDDDEEDWPEELSLNVRVRGYDPEAVAGRVQDRPALVQAGLPLFATAGAAAEVAKEARAEAADLFADAGLEGGGDGGKRLVSVTARDGPGLVEAGQESKEELGPWAAGRDDDGANSGGGAAAGASQPPPLPLHMARVRKVLRSAAAAAASADRGAARRDAGDEHASVVSAAPSTVLVPVGAAAVPTAPAGAGGRMRPRPGLAPPGFHGAYPPPRCMTLWPAPWMPEAMGALSVEHARLGDVPCGSALHWTLAVQNHRRAKHAKTPGGEGGAVEFCWADDHPLVRRGVLRVHPRRGVVPAGSSALCRVTLRSPVQPEVVEAALTCTLQVPQAEMQGRAGTAMARVMKVQRKREADMRAGRVDPKHVPVALKTTISRDAHIVAATARRRHVGRSTVNMSAEVQRAKEMSAASSAASAAEQIHLVLSGPDRAPNSVASSATAVAIAASGHVFDPAVARVAAVSVAVTRALEEQEEREMEEAGVGTQRGAGLGTAVAAKGPSSRGGSRGPSSRVGSQAASRAASRFSLRRADTDSTGAEATKEAICSLPAPRARLHLKITARCMARDEFVEAHGEAALGSFFFFPASDVGRPVLPAPAASMAPEGPLAEALAATLAPGEVSTRETDTGVGSGTSAAAGASLLEEVLAGVLADVVRSGAVAQAAATAPRAAADTFGAMAAQLSAARGGGRAAAPVEQGRARAYALRGSEVRGVVGRCLESTVLNLVREALLGDWHPQVAPMRLVRLGAQHEPPAGDDE